MYLEQNWPHIRISIFQCSKSCGGGQQVRHIQCVDIVSQEAAEGCAEATKPSAMLTCSTDECKSNNQGTCELALSEKGILKWGMSVRPSCAACVYPQRFLRSAGPIFVKLGTVMRYCRCLMHVKQILALCQNVLISDVFRLILTSFYHSASIIDARTDFFFKWYSG